MPFQRYKVWGWSHSYLMCQSHKVFGTQIYTPIIQLMRKGEEGMRREEKRREGKGREEKGREGKGS